MGAVEHRDTRTSGWESGLKTDQWGRSITPGGVRVLTVVPHHQLGVWGVGGSLKGLTVRG